MVPFKISEEENIMLRRIHTSVCSFGCFTQFNKMFKSTHEHPIYVYTLMFFFFNLPRVIQAILKFIVANFASRRFAMNMDCVKQFRSEEID